MYNKQNKYFLFIFLAIILSMTNAFAETPDQTTNEPSQPSLVTVSQSVYQENQSAISTPQDATARPTPVSQEQTYSGPFPMNPAAGGFVIESDHLGGSLSAVESVNQETAGGTVNLASVNFPNITMNGLSLYKNFKVNGQPFVLHITTMNSDDQVNLGNGNIALSEFYAGTLNIPTDKGDIISIPNTFKQKQDLIPALTPFTQVPLNAENAKMNVHSLEVKNLSISHFEMRIEPGQF